MGALEAPVSPSERSRALTTVPKLLDRAEADAIAAVVIRSLEGRAADVLAGAPRYDWRRSARPEQLAPTGDWRTWLVLAGRGWGKTRTGAEWVRAQVEAGRAHRLAVVGRTAADVRDVMVEGPSGLLAVCPPSNRPRYEPSKRRVVWPSGAQVASYSAEEPDRLRGPQHDGAWADELAAWSYPDAWDQLQFGLRIGPDPRVVVTTTPKPVRLIRELVAAGTTALTRGHTHENRANLAPAFLEQVTARYAGTRLGRQELEAELLEDVPGALWTRRELDDHRVAAAPDLVRVVVGVDPAVSAGEGADETGIVVVGLGVDGHGYVLADASCRMSPDGWARRAVEAYRRHAADRIVAEVNNGGDLVERVLRVVEPTVAYRAVRASRGKQTRAEPVAALYEQGRVHHVGTLPDLEDQLCSWAPDAYDGSPDRLDALVWALTELISPVPTWRAF